MIIIFWMYLTNSSFMKSVPLKIALNLFLKLQKATFGFKSFLINTVDMTNIFETFLL